MSSVPHESCFRARLRKALRSWGSEGRGFESRRPDYLSGNCRGSGLRTPSHIDGETQACATEEVQLNVPLRSIVGSMTGDGAAKFLLLLAILGSCIGCDTRDGPSTQSTPVTSASAAAAVTARGDIAQSGKRLRLQNRAGVPLAMGTAWDAELAFECSVQLSMDRTFRCLPQRVDRDAHLVFLDAKCTRPIIEVCHRSDSASSPANTGPEVIAGVPSSYSHDFALYPQPSNLTDPFYAVAGNTVEAPGPRYYHDYADTCRPADDDVRVKGVCIYRRIERSLNQTDFVGLSAPAPTGPKLARLRPRFVDGSDHSRLLYDFWDTGLGVACRFDLDEAAGERCLPHLPEYGFFRTYVDDYCQEQGVFVCSLLPEDPTVVPTRPWPRAGPNQQITDPLEFAFLRSDTLYPHSEISGKCHWGTGMISHPTCRARRIDRLVPRSAFAENKDIGVAISDGAVRALRESLPRPPPMRQKIEPIRHVVMNISIQEATDTPKNEAFSNIVKQNYGRFRLCFVERKRRDRDAVLQGEMTASVTTDKRSGAVSARALTSTLDDPSTVACVVRAFKEITFPEVSRPVEARVTFTFRLEPAPLTKH